MTDPTVLEAHHVIKLRDGGTNHPANGVCVRRHHHRVADGFSAV